MDIALNNTLILFFIHFTLKLSTKPAWGFSKTPSLKKQKMFFDLETCQATVSLETSLEKVWHFFPVAKIACLLH